MPVYFRWLWHKPDNPGMDRSRSGSWSWWDLPVPRPSPTPLTFLTLPDATVKYMPVPSRWLWHKPDDSAMDRRGPGSSNGWDLPLHPPSPTALAFLTWIHIYSIPCIPDGYDTSQMILEWMEGDKAVQLDGNLQIPPTIHLHLPFSKFLYQMPIHVSLFQMVMTQARWFWNG